VAVFKQTLRVVACEDMPRGESRVVSLLKELTTTSSEVEDVEVTVKTARLSD